MLLERSALTFPDDLLANNRRWAERMKTGDPGFFERLAHLQSPKHLWIGCADSRVPASEIVGLAPGELFVHRNVGNIVVHTDLNCLSVLQYAIDVLHIEHIMVTGHYGCGGVVAAMGNQELGLIDNWLRVIKDVYHQNRHIVDAIADESDRMNRMCELNVAQQVANVCHTTIVQNAWHRGAQLSVHGLIYDIQDGLLQDLGFRVTGIDQIPHIYRIENPTDLPHRPARR